METGALTRALSSHLRNHTVVVLGCHKNRPLMVALISTKSSSVQQIKPVMDETSPRYLHILEIKLTLLSIHPHHRHQHKVDDRFC